MVRLYEHTAAICIHWQVSPVEVACERLRSKHVARLKSKEVTADLELYVPPLCAPSKDTPDGDDSIKDLNDSVTSWLTSDGHQVLLLHGQSGSGKSLYVSSERRGESEWSMGWSIHVVVLMDVVARGVALQSG